MNPRFIQLPDAVPVRARTVGVAAVAAADEATVLPRPPELSLHDWAVFLLHTAAEVEHALLVQYLFAAYSIKPQTVPGSAVMTAAWQRSMIAIAKEEMGHLLSLQNVLRFVGGPPNLEREDFPIRSLFYPFTFTLEKLSKDSLSKYVFAEMPEGDIPEAILPASERMEITERARRAAGVTGGSFLNHVGTLYRTLDEVFQDQALDGFRPNRLHYQARAAAPWSQTNETVEPAGQVPTGRKVFRVSTRQEAIDALSAIARQGEAAQSNSDLMASHFGKFLRIYREFPDGFDPAWPVATNPNTDRTHATPGTITNDETFAWAQLFNVRYRILLTQISHAVLIPATAVGDPNQIDPVNRLLVQWIYDEMVQSQGSLRDLGLKLVRMPLGMTAVVTAGPPFELPYALALPDLEPERWRVHYDLIAATADIIARIKAGAPNPDPILDEILAVDAARLPEIQARMQ